jgi:16S rRNA (guanine966-N2)-methyltransferase
MSVKILGGIFKGQELVVPDQLTTRPTAVQLRRKFFDRFQHLDQTIFIDLCCGSGPMGFEALSRGAEHVHFVENRPAVIALLKKNLQQLQSRTGDRPLSTACTIHQSDVKVWLQQHQALIQGMSTMVYFDPPYEDHQLYADVLNLFGGMSDPPQLFVESDEKKGPSPSFWRALPWELKKCYNHGAHFINWYWPQSPRQS